MVFGLTKIEEEPERKTIQEQVQKAREDELETWEMLLLLHVKHFKMEKAWERRHKKLEVAVPLHDQLCIMKKRMSTPPTKSTTFSTTCRGTTTPACAQLKLHKSYNEQV